MQWIVDHFYFFILLLGIAHFFLLVGLWSQRRARVRALAVYLHNLVKHFSTTPDAHPGSTLDEQIDTFIADIREVIHDRSRSADRSRLYHRMVVKDESKLDIQGARLETLYNVARNGIEAYPLLGILGTIFAIALGLNAPRSPVMASAPTVAPAAQLVAPLGQPPLASANDPSADEGLSVASSGAIIRNFANSIWSTAAGIGFAIILMISNAFVEPGFERLVNHRRNVREVIASAKITLGMGSASADRSAAAKASSAAEEEEEAAR